MGPARKRPSGSMPERPIEPGHQRLPGRCRWYTGRRGCTSGSRRTSSGWSHGLDVGAEGELELVGEAPFQRRGDGRRAPGSRGPDQLRADPVVHQEALDQQGADHVVLPVGMPTGPRCCALTLVVEDVLVEQLPREQGGAVRVDPRDEGRPVHPDHRAEHLVLRVQLLPVGVGKLLAPGQAPSRRTAAPSARTGSPSSRRAG
jgi:hypothetical protein